MAINDPKAKSYYDISYRDLLKDNIYGVEDQKYIRDFLAKSMNTNSIANAHVPYRHEYRLVLDEITKKFLLEAISSEINGYIEVMGALKNKENIEERIRNLQNVISQLTGKI